MNKNKKGFTLVELLISVSVIIILTAIALPIFTTTGSNQILVQNSENIKSDIRLVQAKALSGIVSGNNGYWGIRFICDGTGKSTNYLLGQPGDSNNPLSDILNGSAKFLVGGIYVQCTNSFQVVFLKNSTKPANGGVSIVVKDGKNPDKTIVINSEGSIE
ncbi:MAG: prepilin-type N-terminal cleavage/methylation domain-containing protein [bacterium]